jgi:hypothetical protein
MSTYLFLWNPTKWDWSHIDGQIEQIKQSIEVVEDWATDRKKDIGKGDQFILVRVGSHPKGVVGIGEISKDIFEREHWSSDHDKKHKILNFVELKFQALSKEPLISLDYLELNFPNIKWTPQSNGNVIPQEIASEIFEELSKDLKPNDEIQIEKEILESPHLAETEKQQLILSRKGQGNFRKLLMKYWNGCSITNCKLMDVLIASHIKPWKYSDNEERLNLYNGLLLTPNLDKLFDKGLISFENNGHIIISDKVSPYMNELGISPSMRVYLTNEHESFMEYHRKNVFRPK